MRGREGGRESGNGSVGRAGGSEGRRKRGKDAHSAGERKEGGREGGIKEKERKAEGREAIW